MELADKRLEDVARPFFYGTYVGTVIAVDNVCNTTDMKTIRNDTKRFQRIKVMIPGIDSIEVEAASLPDAIMSYSKAGRYWGDFSPVLPNDKVFVSFLDGDPQYRVIMGRYHTSSDIPPIMRLNYPYREGFISRGGHIYCFDNQDDTQEEINSQIFILSKGGNMMKMRDFYRDYQLINTAGARLSLRGEDSNADDDYNANKGVLIEGNYDGDNPTKRYSLKFDEEENELEIKSKEGYTITLRDVDGSGGSEEKGITIKTAAGRKIIIDEKNGKLEITHSDVTVDSARIKLGDATSPYEPAVLGDLLGLLLNNFIAWANTHTHPGPGVPPAPPFVPSPSISSIKSTQVDVGQ